MEKRKLIRLRTVLLRYLLLCGGGCILLLLIWWGIFMQLIHIGFLFPASASAQACAEAREITASMTAETFDSSAISNLCRWAVVQGDTVLRTNMTDRQLKIALSDYHGGSGNVGLTMYQYNVKMTDGSFCLLQYDYAVPYADPALRRILPDFQTVYLLLLAALFAIWLTLITHRTLQLFTSETARMTQAVQAIAAQQPETIQPHGVRIREFADTLQSMQTMGQELTDSLQSQWRLEQQRNEELAALTHDLKTPLAIIQGNADLLAEDALAPEQREQVQAILRSTERAGQYLTALRSASTPATAKKPESSHDILVQLSQTARALCAPAGVQFLSEELWQGEIPVARSELIRAVENLLDNAVRHTPGGGSVTLTAARENTFFLLRVTDTGPGFSAEALAKAGKFLYTEASRSDASHQGLGLYTAKRTATAQGGKLRLSNVPGGCAELLVPICEQIEK